MSGFKCYFRMSILPGNLTRVSNFFTEGGFPQVNTVRRLFVISTGIVYQVNTSGV